SAGSAPPDHRRRALGSRAGGCGSSRATAWCLPSSRPHRTRSAPLFPGPRARLPRRPTPWQTRSGPVLVSSSSCSLQVCARFPRVAARVPWTTSRDGMVTLRHGAVTQRLVRARVPTRRADEPVEPPRSTMVEQDLRSTTLEAVHESLGATFTDFAGWKMPVRYDSDLAEHRAVRESAGLFDLSHMGEIHLRGPEAGAALDFALAGKLSTVAVGRAKYSLLLSEEGGVIDDIIAYRLSEEHFLVVANASNAEVDAAERLARAEGFDVEVDDASARTSLLAVQGPAAEQILLDAMAADGSAIGGLTAEDITGMKNYRFAKGTFGGEEMLVARTGYTGEDGFELYVPNAQATALWELLTAAGGDRLAPCGLACRDTLRLEAGMPLYGNELSRELLP